MQTSFLESDKPYRPLAERVRPTSLIEIIGQPQVTEPLSGRGLHSFLLWGPPGVGKTTVARAYAEVMELDQVSLSAISSGVADLRKWIQEADERRQAGLSPTLLFIDEIHHFNKTQQDVLLRAVEDGTIILVGATTENPAFSLNSALLSRCHVYPLQPLSPESLDEILTRAINSDPILSEKQIEIDEGGKDALISRCGADARKLLTILELACEEGNPITRDIVIDVAGKALIRFDRAGDQHYDTISAFIKSVRGSDPDAAIYYLAVMLEGGEDPRFIARRLVILASEDIGNAYPTGLNSAVACFQAVERIGMPECAIVLAQTTTLLASVPKSNRSYMAIKKAMKHIKQFGSEEVPLHLRNAPTKLAKELKHGEGYVYPHDFANHFTNNQEYLPLGLAHGEFYVPSEQGQEKTLRARLHALWGTPFPEEPS